MRKPPFSLLPSLLATLLCVSAQAEVAVVVSPRSAMPALSADQAAELFLGQQPWLVGGSRVEPLDQNEGNTAREEFYRKVSGKSPVQLNAYWSKRVFTGRGQPPRALPDNAAVKRMVAANPATIGYIDRSAVDGSVKVLLLIP